jgi:N-acetylneuraminate synthase
MNTRVKIGERWVGDGEPCFVVAEIGINHNGDVELAKRLVDSAHLAGCDAVKFQKRTPDLCVPLEQRSQCRDTPWGVMSYIDYRRKIEFGRDEYSELDKYCARKGIAWFASAWDVPSVDFLEDFGPLSHKVPSACLTDEALLRRLRETGRPVFLSTGMSTIAQIDRAVELLGKERLVILHTTSTYPCPPDQLNLRAMLTLGDRFHVPVGYSGHETGLQTTIAAVVLGACVVERHITLDRSMWGSDQAASVEPHGFARLVRDIRVIERAMGDGVKRVYDSEIPVRKKLRRVDTVAAAQK